MSKSLGNFFTVRDLLDQGIPGEVIRFVFLMTHYRKPMDWTADKAREAEAVLRRWRGLVAGIEPAASPAPTVVAALADDLNTAGAIAELHRIAEAIRNPDAMPDDLRQLAGDDDLELKRIFLASAGMLGLLTDALGGWIAPAPDLSPLAARMQMLRAEAKASKDFSAVDALKTALTEAGVEVRMTAQGVELIPGTGFDAARLPQ